MDCVLGFMVLELKALRRDLSGELWRTLVFKEPCIRETRSKVTLVTIQ